MGIDWLALLCAVVAYVVGFFRGRRRREPEVVAPSLPPNTEVVSEELMERYLSGEEAKRVATLFEDVVSENMEMIGVLVRKRLNPPQIFPIWKFQDGHYLYYRIGGAAYSFAISYGYQGGSTEVWRIPLWEAIARREISPLELNSIRDKKKVWQKIYNFMSDLQVVTPDEVYATGVSAASLSRAERVMLPDGGVLVRREGEGGRESWTLETREETEQERLTGAEEDVETDSVSELGG